jgi:hypothetical protein
MAILDSVLLHLMLLLDSQADSRFHLKFAHFVTGRQEIKTVERRILREHRSPLVSKPRIIRYDAHMNLSSEEISCGCHVLPLFESLSRLMTEGVQRFNLPQVTNNLENEFLSISFHPKLLVDSNRGSPSPTKHMFFHPFYYRQQVPQIQNRPHSDPPVSLAWNPPQVDV